MREEINNYGIYNPDGLNIKAQDARNQKYDNDNPKYIKEDSLKGQKESRHILLHGPDHLAKNTTAVMPTNRPQNPRTKPG